jgi:hypothetical protein
VTPLKSRTRVRHSRMAPSAGGKARSKATLGFEDESSKRVAHLDHLGQVEG